MGLLATVEGAASSVVPGLYSVISSRPIVLAIYRVDTRDNTDRQYQVDGDCIMMAPARRLITDRKQLYQKREERYYTLSGSE
jgi:hypothetical protein